MFTSEMESMLAMLMLIPTVTGGPEGREKKLKSVKKHYKDNMKILYVKCTFDCAKQSKLME